MPKLIKIKEPIYDQLDQLRRGSDTFGDVIKRLLVERRAIIDMVNQMDRPEDQD